jgi:hypothetical protein
MQSEFIEISNGVMTVINIAIMFTFCGYAWRSWRSGMSYMDVKPAMAFSVLIIGASSTRAWAWLWIWQSNRGIPTQWMDIYPVNPIGLIITVVGGLCVLRIFTPKDWSWTVWLATLILAAFIPTVIFFVGR